MPWTFLTYLVLQGFSHLFSLTIGSPKQDICERSMFKNGEGNVGAAATAGVLAAGLIAFKKVHLQFFRMIRSVWL